MKYYRSYMDRQEVSSEIHEKLLHLEPPKRRSLRPWARYGALAACAALIIGVGARLSPDPGRGDASEQIKDCQSYEPQPGERDAAAVPAPGADSQAANKDAADPGVKGAEDTGSRGAADFHGFTVSGPGDTGKRMFPMIPYISYPDRTGYLQADASRAYAPGAFMTDLEKEDIQTIFWGPEGKPEASHPKEEQGDLPWMLFWDGYTVHGFAWYDGQGQLTELAIYGSKDRCSFALELRLGELPLTCCVDMNWGDEISDVFGVSVAGWSKVYDRDGDGQDDYICGSEFMTKNDIGVRFVNQNSTMRAEYGNEDSITFQDMTLGGVCTFNALFVRQALTGGLYLDHLAVNENVPAWREEEFSTLAQARQETDFAPYLPASNLEGEFYGRLSYQEGQNDRLFVRWTRGYDNVEVCVYRDGFSCHLADPSKPETYDLRLYPTPWCDSVPREHWDTVNDPSFRAEDMSLAIVEARGCEHDTGGMTWSFNVLHPEGVLVSYRCDGMTAQQVWEMVKETL